MRKFLNNPVVVVALALAAAALVYQQVATGAKPGPARVALPMEAYPPEEDTLDHGETPATLDANLFAFKVPAHVRDPFAARPRDFVAPPVEEHGNLPQTTFTVSAVWMQNDQVLAVVNQQIRRVGEMVGFVTVDSITRDGAWIRHGQGREFVAVGRHVSLTPPPRSAAAARLLAVAP
jgi:hypothetical protein